MDISVRCDGVLVRRAQRIVLAAFSNNFEKVLHGIKNVALNLDIDSSITGTLSSITQEFLDYLEEVFSLKVNQIFWKTF